MIGMQNTIYIAGAHSRGRTFKAYCNFLYPETEIKAFLVNDMSENEEIVDGIPVRLIDSCLDISCPVYIGTRGINHPLIIEELKAVGFKEIIPVSVELDMKLRNEYVRKFYQSQGRIFTAIDELYVKEYTDARYGKNICG